MKRVIQVVLDEDTADFLEISQGPQGPKDTSSFINSLLRQERFRQGYPAFVTDISRHPVRTWVEKHMLQRSGLLPLNPAHR